MGSDESQDPCWNPHCWGVTTQAARPLWPASIRTRPCHDGSYDASLWRFLCRFAQSMPHAVPCVCAQPCASHATFSVYCMREMLHTRSLLVLGASWWTVACGNRTVGKKDVGRPPRFILLGQQVCCQERVCSRYIAIIIRRPGSVLSASDILPYYDVLADTKGLTCEGRTLHHTHAHPL